MEGVSASGNSRRSRAPEPLDQWLQQRKVGERIARALQEQQVMCTSNK